MALPGISTVGIKLGYAVGDLGAANKPNAFTLLTRINAIGNIAMDVEQIDASALEDEVSKYIAGRADTGGTVSITVNVTDDTIEEWEAVFTASKGATAQGKSVWFENWSPSRQKAFYFCAQTPPVFPMPSEDQNALETVEIVLTINEVIGWDTAIEPTGTTTTT